MKVLLDENLDWRLVHDLPGHAVKCVSKIGWSGIKNGELLARAQNEFDVFITMDSSIPYQQNLSQYRLALIGLKARSNRLCDTKPLMVKVLEALPSLQPGTITIIS